MHVIIKIMDTGNLKAFASVILPTEVGDIEVKGFKVMEGKDGGLWVAMPSREVKRDGKTEYFNQVYIEDKDAYEAFRNKIIDAYYAETGQGAKDREPKPAVKRQAKRAETPAPSNTDPIREPGEDRSELPPHDENPYPGEDCPF